MNKNYREIVELCTVTGEECDKPFNFDCCECEVGSGEISSQEQIRIDGISDFSRGFVFNHINVNVNCDNTIIVAPIEKFDTIRAALKCFSGNPVKYSEFHKKHYPAFTELVDILKLQPPNEVYCEEEWPALMVCSDKVYVVAPKFE